MALTDKLTNIANAIREKGGTSDKLTLAQMPDAIAAIETGGGSGDDKVPEVINITRGDLKFYNDDLKFLRQHYADRINCALENADHMFYNSTSTTDDKSIGFNLKMASGKTYVDGEYMFGTTDILPTQEEIGDLVFLNAEGMFSGNTNEGVIPPITFVKPPHSMNSSCDYMFGNCSAEEIGTITNFKPNNVANLFRNAYRLKHSPVLVNYDNSALMTSAYRQMGCVFENCYSLRSIDESFLKFWCMGKQTSGTYHPYGYMLNYCVSLDEINGIMPTGSVPLTANIFNKTFDHCYHLKNITFALQEDGTPFTTEWKNQTINLTQYTGWAGASGADGVITGWNTGITADKEATSKTTYDALKDDPDWWSRDFNYSRFNHDSAVNLINSLPDTSAYLATQTGATNTVKFYTNAGYSTDGGGVNDLTEEEVAVAAAKGWTIAYGV